MWSFHELDKEQCKEVAEQRKEEYRLAPGDNRGTPKTSKADRALRIVEKSIDAAVGQLWLFVEKEVTEEPSEGSQPACNQRRVMYAALFGSTYESYISDTVHI